jgi:hypothetical protein
MKNPLKREESSIPAELPLERALKQARADLTQSRAELSNNAAKLELLMSEHRAEQDRAKAKCVRIERSLRNQVEAGTTRCLSGDATQLASLVLAGADLEAVIADDRQHLDQIYNRYRGPEGGSESDFADDLSLMKHFDSERATVSVLREAILLQKRSEAALRRSAMAKFAHTINEARGELAKKVLAGLKEAQRFATEDSRITEGLGLQPDETEFLRPKPAPANIVSFELVEWLFDMVTQKLIRAEDLGGLRLTAPQNPRS